MKVPKVIYKKGPKKDAWCRWATARVTRNNNSTQIKVVGEMGSGKSWLSLSVAEKCATMMGKKFNPDYIFFSPLEFMKTLREKEPPPQSIIMMDEAQAGAGSKEHNSAKNKAFALVFSTIRFKRYIIIFTTPFEDMIDKQVRRLFNVEILTKGVNKESKTTRCLPRYLEYSRSKDKVYKKKLWIMYKDMKLNINKKKQVDFWDVEKPSDELIEIYESKKKKFTDRLYGQLAEKLEKYEEDMSGRTKSKTEDNTKELEKERMMWINTQKRNDKGRIICKVCESGNVNVNAFSIMCRKCGYTDIFEKNT